MSARAQLVAALVAVAVGGIALVALLTGTSGSVRSHIAERYAPVAATAAGADDGADDGGARYTSPDPPSVVAADIAEEWEPSERLNDTGGYFLRYRDTIVAVTAASAGGSLIDVDDERRGYARWYPYVGGWWGTFSGPAEGTRGGGPGAGK